jgi:drug/metabolite transporter (DMT)-like permease
MADPAVGVHPADPAAEIASPRRVQAAAGAGWALLSALLFGTTFVIYGYADEVSSVTAAAWGRLTGLAVYLPIALLAVPLHMPRPLYQRVVACAVLDSIAYVAIAAGLARGPVAVASALSAQFATVALVLGVIVLHERPTRVQLVGLLFTITAVVLFSLAAA